MLFRSDPAALTACPPAISVGAGGKQSLAIDAGPGFAFNLYFVIGSTAGTFPGFPFEGVHIPLNLDFYLLYSFTNPNEGPLVSTLGTLSATGTATAQFNLADGGPPAFVGLQLNHAFAALTPGLDILFVSDPVPLALAP